jgi:hypothetical protein
MFMPVAIMIQVVAGSRQMDLLGVALKPQIVSNAGHAILSPAAGQARGTRAILPYKSATIRTADSAAARSGCSLASP